jgi:type IV pilus assembly protein PilW
MDQIVKRQQGFSLVELMIAMFLGLFVLSGLTAAMVGDQRSYETGRANHLLLTKSRMSQYMLRMYIQQAGYKDFEQIYNSTELPADSDWEEGQALYALNDVTSSSYAAALAGTDVLQLRFYGADDEGIKLCNGEAAESGEVTTLVLYVDGSNQLTCSDGSNTTVLATDVEQLQFLFGQSDSDSYAHLTADDVSDWTIVNQVRTGLLAAQSVSQGTVINSSSYTLLGMTIDAENDTKLRKRSVSAILIGNAGN